MKVVVFNGSPRPDGWTKKLSTAITSILQKAGTEIEMTDVFNLPISDCYHCMACRENGGHCVGDDVTDSLLDKISSADMVVFASPVYWTGVTAPLKCVIDKMYARVPEYRNAGKKLGVIMVGEAPVEEPQYGAIRAQFACIADYLGWEFSFYKTFCSDEA